MTGADSNCYVSSSLVAILKCEATQIFGSFLRTARSNSGTESREQRLRFITDLLPHSNLNQVSNELQLLLGKLKSEKDEPLCYSFSDAHQKDVT